MPKNIDISTGTVSLTFSDMAKLLGAVAAIVISWMMASARLSVIEQDIRDGKASLVQTQERYETLESRFSDHVSSATENRHALDLRINALELRASQLERKTGTSRSN